MTCWRVTWAECGISLWCVDQMARGQSLQIFFISYHWQIHKAKRTATRLRSTSGAEKWPVICGRFLQQSTQEHHERIQTVRIVLPLLTHMHSGAMFSVHVNLWLVKVLSSAFKQIDGETFLFVCLFFFNKLCKNS